MSVRECRSNGKYIPSPDSDVSFNPLHAVMSSVILSSSDGPGLARRTTICRVGGIVVSRENPLQIREKMSCMGVERDEAVVDLVSVEGAGL